MKKNDRHLSNVTLGAVAFTGIYFVSKSCIRLAKEFDSLNNDKFTSKACTWAMGALGTGFIFGVIGTKN